jgi:MFS family permease
MCSLAAAVQGMDETVNNGAQAFYLKRFNITEARFTKNEVNNLTGLIVGAPYLACAILGCWLTEPLNAVFARRGTIFISCFIAAVASIVSVYCFISSTMVTSRRVFWKRGEF